MKKKDISLSYIRVIAMLIVIMYHCMAGYTTAWGVHGLDMQPFYCAWAGTLPGMCMPLFMFISGYLFGLMRERYFEKGFKLFVKNKGKRLLIPYFFWSAVVVIYSHSEWTALFDGLMHLWFLLALFEMMILAYIGGQIWRKTGKMCHALLVTVVVGMYVFKELSTEGFMWHFCLKGMMQYQLFFFLGVFVGAKRGIFDNLLGFGGTLVVVLLMILVQLAHSFQLPPFAQSGWCYFTVKTLLSVCFCIGMMNTFRRFTATAHRRLDAVIERLSDLSMSIYLFQQFIILIILKPGFVLDMANSHYIVFPILLFAVTLAICYAMALVLRKTPMRYIL